MHMLLLVGRRRKKSEDSKEVFEGGVGEGVRDLDIFVLRISERGGSKEEPPRPLSGLSNMWEEVGLCFHAVSGK
jgi:hypothetical protein